MSKQSPLSLIFAERIFGAIMAIIGLILTYNTLANLNVAGLSSGYSILAGVLLIVVGLILLIAQTSPTKTENEES